MCGVISSECSHYRVEIFQQDEIYYARKLKNDNAGTRR